MRQPQQKSRGRGRGRKQHNPLSRNYESNGPDVKIRGNASHVAEKYTSLARDALSNGDTVMAENYYQHAEHYNRIVAAVQSQQNANRNEDNQNANANSSQPDVDSVPAEAAVKENESAANADDKNQNLESSQDGVDDAKPKRQSKRSKKTESNGDASKEDADKVEARNSGDEDGSSVADGVSEDAAKLPGSIIGDLTVEENT